MKRFAFYNHIIMWYKDRLSWARSLDVTNASKHLLN